jgi:hypothetical protein
MKEYVLITLMLLPFEETFYIDSKLSLMTIKATHCDINIKTKYHEPPTNKHEITINNKKYQLIGKLCE